MASRPLPPGRRGRGGRTMSTQHLPETKILSMDADVSTPTSSYAEQLRVAASNDKPLVEPEHESSAQEQGEPTPVRSVKAFVATLERGDALDGALAFSVPTETGEVLARHTASTPTVTEAKPAVAYTQQPLPAIIQPPAPVVTESVPVQPPAPAVVHTPAPVAVHTPAATTIYPPTSPAAVLARNFPEPTPSFVSTPPTAASIASQQPELPRSDGYHPFQLLLPVYSVPVVPEQVECVYDDEAVEMQKNIMKAVKKIFGKDRAKLEDFKINSRLYGNNFMDAVEYLDSLAKDLGGNRALLLVPCLLSIQPDFMKRSSLLVATRNYRLRNLAKLEAALDTEVRAAPEPARQSPTPVAQADSATPTVIAATAAPIVVATLEPAVPATVSIPAAVSVGQEDVVENLVAHGDVLEEEAKPIEDEDAFEPPSVAETAAPVVEVAAPCYAEPPAELFIASVEDTSPTAEVFPDTTQVLPVEAKPDIISESVVAVAETSAIETSLPAPDIEVPVVKDEPMAAAELTTVTIDVSPIDLESSPTTFVPARTTESPAPSEGSSTSSADADGLSLFRESINPVQPTPQRRQSTINLFGEDLGHEDDDEDDEEHQVDEPNHSTTTPAAPVSSTPALTAPVVPTPPSSVSSYFEAESLFGEVLPPKAPEAPPAHAQVPSVVAPSPLPPPAVIRPQHSGMLFGFGTVGDDSDSDSDSDFSD